MKRVKDLLEGVKAGAYDKAFVDLYGDDGVERARTRYSDTLTRFGQIYGWGTNAEVFSFPLAVALPTQGAEVAVSLTEDVMCITAVNGVNVSRLQAHAYFGEDNVDFFQRGPYTQEEGKTASLVRGVTQALRQRGHDAYGIDVYVNADTVPGSGLSRPEPLAALLACLYNRYFNDGNLGAAELADIARWAIVNHYGASADKTTMLAGILGGTLRANYTGALPRLTRPALADGGVFTTVNTGLLNPRPDEAEMAREQGKAAMALGKLTLDDVPEKEFYAMAPDIAEKAGKEAVLAAADFYTRKNLDALGEKMTAPGKAGPDLPRTMDAIGDTAGGCSVWRSHVFHPYWCAGHLVADKAMSAYGRAMEALFGPGCWRENKPREKGLVLVMGE